MDDGRSSGQPELPLLSLRGNHRLDRVSGDRRVYLVTEHLAHLYGILPWFEPLACEAAAEFGSAYERHVRPVPACVPRLESLTGGPRHGQAGQELKRFGGLNTGVPEL